MTTRPRSRRLWRGLCMVAVSGVVGCLLVLLAVAWWLSFHHYQPFLTQHLSTLLGAEVRVARSAVSFRHGLGIGLERLVVQDRSEAVPFFTAERVDVLLDLTALLRGQLLFQHIYCLRPRIRLTAGDGTVSLPPLVARVLQGQTPDDGVGHGWLSPRLAVRRLVFQDTQVRYGGPGEDAELVVMETDLDLSYSDGEGLSARLQLGLGAGGEMGTDQPPGPATGLGAGRCPGPARVERNGPATQSQPRSGWPLAGEALATGPARFQRALGGQGDPTV